MPSPGLAPSAHSAAAGAAPLPASSAPTASLRGEARSGPQPAARIALVTGAARRLGREIALALARQGWDVAVHYGRSTEAAAQTVQDIEALGRRSVALQADLADEAATAALIARCSAALGLPTCLVNNASLFEYDAPASFSYAALEAHLRTNTAAPLCLARELHAALEAEAAPAGQGVVIHVLDQKLAHLNPDYFSYTLSKAALQTAMTMQAQAFSPRLRIVGLAPGLTLPAPNQGEAAFAHAHQQAALGQSSTPGDIAAAVCYLAEARAVTNTTLYVDGGQHLLALPRDVALLPVPHS